MLTTESCDDRMFNIFSTFSNPNSSQNKSITIDDEGGDSKSKSKVFLIFCFQLYLNLFKMVKHFWLKFYFITFKVTSFLQIWNQPIAQLSANNMCKIFCHWLTFKYEVCQLKHMWAFKIVAFKNNMNLDDARRRSKCYC